MKTGISGNLGNIQIGQPAGGMGFSRGTLWHTALGEASVLYASVGVAVKIPLQQAQGWFQHQTGVYRKPMSC